MLSLPPSASRAPPVCFDGDVDYVLVAHFAPPFDLPEPALYIPLRDTYNILGGIGCRGIMDWASGRACVLNPIPSAFWKCQPRLGGQGDRKRLLHVGNMRDRNIYFYESFGNLSCSSYPWRNLVDLANTGCSQDQCRKAFEECRLDSAASNNHNRQAGEQYPVGYQMEK